MHSSRKTTTADQQALSYRKKLYAGAVEMRIKQSKTKASAAVFSKSQFDKLPVMNDAAVVLVPPVPDTRRQMSIYTSVFHQLCDILTSNCPPARLSANTPRIFRVFLSAFHVGMKRDPGVFTANKERD